MMNSPPPDYRALIGLPLISVLLLHCRPDQQSRPGFFYIVCPALPGLSDTMAIALGGVYKHVSDENLEAYERARAGITEDQLKTILNQHPVVEIRQDGDVIYMKTTLNFRPVQELKFKLGEAWFSTTPDGRKISNVFFMDGNRLIQKQTDEQENYIEYVREFKGDMMYLELRRGPILAKRCFKKVPGL
ncbi:hypothetical protein BV898_08659 [Hypsibius exemplaris]|uniref:Lipocalin/cytosolic fatty-acid binding domain-containing protein n=1 Tax=Hypsibius exemplaris TaxID=2072580 RepID=A0A1W0WPX4_HYPEX|nr:hypothetical protein BV898_08659 [Hypsibius exemplaris]